MTIQHPIVHIYDQHSIASQTGDPNFCVAAAYAAAWQSLTGTTGNYARKIYERTKRHPNNQRTSDQSGTTVGMVHLASHTDYNTSILKLTTLPAVAAFLKNKGPVILSVRQYGVGMQHAIVRKSSSWWRRLLSIGPKWVDPTDKRYPAALGHSFLIVGMDTTAAVPYVLLQNSFGKRWGNGGTARLTLRHLEGLFSNATLYGLSLKTEQSK